MSLKKKIARKATKSAKKGDDRSKRLLMRATRGVHGAYVEQLKNDRRCRKTAIQNLCATFMYAMNQNYGFGRKRLEKLKAKMQSEFDAIVAGNVSVEEIAAFLRDEIGLDCGIAASNPKANHYRQIEFKVVQQMSGAFLMALLDEFNFKKKRLADAYGYCADLSDQLGAGELTYQQIGDHVTKVMEKAA